jgi:hypothetical protein
MDEKTLIVIWCKGQRIGSTFELFGQVKDAFQKDKLRLNLIQRDISGVVYPNDGSEPYHQTVFHYNVTK